MLGAMSVPNPALRMVFKNDSLGNSTKPTTYFSTSIMKECYRKPLVPWKKKENLQADSPFFRLLPTELRRHIYELVHRGLRMRYGFRPPEGPVYRGFKDGKFSSSFLDLPLLRVCQRMYYDIGHSWMGHVLFFMEDQSTLVVFMSRLGELRQYIRRLCVREHPGGSMLPPSASWSRWRAHATSAHAQSVTPLPIVFQMFYGLRLDELTVLASGDPWHDYRTIDLFVKEGIGYKKLRVVLPNSLSLKSSWILRPSLLCDNRSLRRRPQPESWNRALAAREVRVRDEEIADRVKIYRAKEPSQPTPADDGSGVGFENWEHNEGVHMDSFAVLDPRKREPWAQPLDLDDYPDPETISDSDGSSVEEEEAMTEEESELVQWKLKMLTGELHHEILVVVDQGSRAGHLEVPSSSHFWESRPTRQDMSPGDWYIPGALDAEEFEKRPETTQDERSGAKKLRSEPKWDTERISKSERKAQQAMFEYMDNFKFLYPYDARWEAGLDLEYSVDMTDTYEHPEDFGGWGVFAESGRYTS